MLDIQDELKSINIFNLKDYKKGECIGTGGCGSVYLANKKEKSIAIKQLNIKNGIDDDSKEYLNQMIIREIKNMSKCSSFTQVIVPFHGISFKDLNGNLLDYPLIILDYANNGSLQKFLNDSKAKQTPIQSKRFFYMELQKQWNLCIFFTLLIEISNQQM